MVVWGGLRPIPSQLIVDGVTLTAWVYGALVSVQSQDGRPIRETAVRSFLWIVLSCILAIEVTGSLTNRCSHRYSARLEQPREPSPAAARSARRSARVAGGAGGGGRRRRGADQPAEM